jgi:Tol biopolymer transport system component
VEFGSTTVITTEYARLGALAWSPDDAGIAFAAQTESNVNGMDLWYLDLSSQYLSLLADCTSPKTSGYSCDSPTWSDDHQLAYVRRTDPAQARVEVLDIPSGEIETWVDEISLLYPDVPLGTDDSSEGSACSVLSISPDGRHLALVVGRGSGTLPFGADLYVLDISTRALRGVTLKRSWSDCPKWIDNHRVVFRIISWGKGTGLLNPSELVVNQKHQIAVVDIHTRSGPRIAETIFSDDIKVGCPFTIPMSSVKRLVGLQ